MLVARRAVVALVILATVLAPMGAWAQMGSVGAAPGSMGASGRRPGFRPPAHRPPIHRPRPPVVPFFNCCADLSYFPDEPPPVYVPPPPTVIYIVPSPPSLVYIPTPRVEPAPEITGEKGTWARHGNGKEYPYTWVFQPAHRSR